MRWASLAHNDTLRWETWHMTTPCDGNHSHTMAPCDGQFYSHRAHAVGYIGTRWHLAIDILGTRWHLAIGNLARCDGQLGTHWHLAMGNLVRIGTLTWATWQPDAPSDGQHGTIRHLTMDNFAMALRDGQLSTQWHHATSIVGTLLYHTMGNLAHNGPHGMGNLPCNGTTCWAT